MSDTVERVLDEAVRRLPLDKRFFHPPCEPASVYFLTDAKGDPVRFEATMPERSVAGDLDSLIRTVKNSATEDKPAGREVWYDRNQVIGTVAQNNRYVNADCTLMPTPASLPMTTLAEWGMKTVTGGVELDQNEFRRHLRITFAGCLNDAARLLAQIEDLEVLKEQKLNAKFTERGVSVDRSMRAESNMKNKLPEALTFEVPVYENGNLKVKAKVVVALEFDAEASRFVLCPLPGQVEAAFVAGETWINGQLVALMREHEIAEKVPLYYGKPF